MSVTLYGFKIGGNVFPELRPEVFRSREGRDSFVKELAFKEGEEELKRLYEYEPRRFHTFDVSSGPKATTSVFRTDGEETGYICYSYLESTLMD